MIIAGIVAGGTGSRMGGGELPKQFLELALKPVFIYTAEKFLKYADAVVIGMNPDWIDYANELLEKFFHHKEKIFLVKGGSDRNETVKNIISFSKESLKCIDSDIILTHDAVRPFVSDEIIYESISQIEKCDICLRGQVISKELLMRTFSQFLSETIEKDKHNINIITRELFS